MASIMVSIVAHVITFAYILLRNVVSVDAATSKPKTDSIKSGSVGQQILFDLFEEKGWLLLPKRNDELNKLMKDNNWNRNQLSRQFSLWVSLGTLGSAVVTITEELLFDSLDERCGTTESILDATKKALNRPLHDVGYSEADKERLFELEKWELFRPEFLKLIASCRAATLSEVHAKSAKFTKLTFELIDRNGANFPGDKAINNFFILFATEFIKQLKTSIAQPDLANFEAAILDDIIDGDFIDLQLAYSETLYYICGYLLKAARKVGKGATDKKTKLGVYEAFGTNHVFAEGKNELLEAGDEARNLPTGKTDRRSNGFLLYPKAHFFQTMVLIERIYLALLTTENLVSFGPAAIKRIHNKLTGDERIRERLKHGMSSLSDGDTECWEKHLDIVVNYILRTYSRVRGKDFARRLLGRSRKSLHSATREELKVKSKATTHVKFEAKHRTKKQPETCKEAQGDTEKADAAADTAAGKGQEEGNQRISEDGPDQEPDNDDDGGSTAEERNQDETDLKEWFESKDVDPDEDDEEPDEADVSSDSDGEAGSFKSDDSGWESYKSN